MINFPLLNKHEPVLVTAVEVVAVVILTLWTGNLELGNRIRGTRVQWRRQALRLLEFVWRFEPFWGFETKRPENKVVESTRAFCRPMFVQTTRERTLWELATSFFDQIRECWTKECFEEWVYPHFGFEEDLTKTNVVCRMGSVIGACLGSCVATCACKGCEAVGGAMKDSRVPYLVILFVFSLVAGILRSLYVSLVFP